MLSALPLARYRRELDQYLRPLLSAQDPPLLWGMVRYQLGWEDTEGKPQDATGKWLRPSLCLLACEAAGGDWRSALPVAAAIELVHNFSLIHDDVQDRDTERHHRPTVWSVWGDAQAINAGDALLALARLQVLRLGRAGLPSEIVVEAARVLDERTLDMVAGQTLDIAFEERLDVDVPAYIDMVEKKSGALFDCALHLGALIGGCDTLVAQRFGRIGRMLGTAFQVRDDILGVWGDENKTGKPLGNDIRRRKKSLPVVYALNEGPSYMRDQLRALYTQPAVSEDDVTCVLSCLDAVRARDYCVLVATDRKNSALAEVDQLHLSAGPVSELMEAADFLLERDF